MGTLHLYPSALARDRALDALGAAAWTGEHRTFAEFSATLAQSAGPNVDGAARLELFSRALKSSDFSDAERARLAGSETALKAAADLIAAWKGAALTAPQIQSASATQPPDSGARETVAALAKLYRAYEISLGERWIDREGNEQLILNRLAKCQRLPERLLARDSAIEVHAFHRLIPFQRQVLERLQQMGYAVTFQQTNSPDSHALTFGALAPAAAKQQTPLPRELRRIEAATPYAEIYEIGRLVRSWIADEGLPPSQICVAFRDLGTYSQSVSDVFRRFEIPYFERRGEPAAFQPIVRVAVSAVHACVGGLMREDLFRFLNAGVIDIAALSGQREVKATGSDLHRLAMDACIDRLFGPDIDDPAGAWARRLQIYIESLVEQSESYRARSERLANTLNKIIARLNTMRVARTLRQHTQAWREFFNDAGLSAARTFLSAQEIGPEVRRKSCLALVEFHKALDSIEHGPLADVSRVTLEEFAQSLERAIAEHSVRADGAEPGGVRVLNLYDLRGLQFKKLVLGGMAEGIFPALSGGHALLGSHGAVALRTALAASRSGGRAGFAFLDPLLPSEAHAEEQALFDIARAAVAEDGTWILSRPKAGLDGQALGPSIFWDQIPESPRSDASAIHPAPKISECIIPEEIELRAAWVLGGGSRDAQERAQAASVYSNSAKLQQIARRAAVERRRYDFFNAQGMGDDAFDAGVTGMELQVKSFGGSYDGIVGQAVPESRALLSDKLLFTPDKPEHTPAKVLSPSAIEKLASCPFRFLVEDVYRFKESQLPEQSLAPVDRGSIWHDILSRFYTEQLEAARKSGRLVAILDKTQEAQYLKSLKSIALRVLEAVPQQAFVGNPGLWKVEQEKIHDSLLPWLKHEIEQSQQHGFHPACTELSFGRDERASAVAVPATGAAGEERQLLLGGRMDRLDLKLADPLAAVPEVIALRVIDYKTGARDSLKPKTKLEVLQKLLAVQLPVYLRAGIGYVLALEQQGLLKVNQDAVWQNSQAGYYCLKDVPKSNRWGDPSLMMLKEWPLGSLEKFLSREAVENGSLFGLLAKSVSEVVQGNFPVKPKECAGAWCAARFTCRYQDVPQEGESGG